MPSLSAKLENTITHYTPLYTLHEVGKEHKQSYVERTLRKLSEGSYPKIVPVRNSKKVIIAYEPTKTITYREDPNNEVEDIEVKFIKANNYFLINYMVIPVNIKNSFENFKNTLKKNKGEETKFRAKKNIVKLYENQTSLKYDRD